MDVIVVVLTLLTSTLIIVCGVLHSFSSWFHPNSKSTVNVITPTPLASDTADVPRLVLIYRLSKDRSF